MVEEKLQYQLEDGSILTFAQYKKRFVPSKKNQQRIAINRKTLKAFMVPSKQYIVWMQQHQHLFDEWNVKLYNAGISLPIMRCKVKVLFYFPDSMDRDLDNKFLTLGDCLIAAGIVPMDSFKIYNDVHLKGWIQREKPRTEIYITILQPGDDEYEVDLTPASYWLKQKKRKSVLRKIQRDKKKRA